mmetsp:Transcript_4450/g.14417  ORF Transcript_4450/g.14417 Transcript_4450/m.14417 type:complete len:286 (+) Transcript_4450:380-1237(+)
MKTRWRWGLGFRVYVRRTRLVSLHPPLRDEDASGRELGGGGVAVLQEVEAVGDEEDLRISAAPVQGVRAVPIARGEHRPAAVVVDDEREVAREHPKGADHPRKRGAAVHAVDEEVVEAEEALCVVLGVLVAEEGVVGIAHRVPHPMVSAGIPLGNGSAEADRDPVVGVEAPALEVLDDGGCEAVAPLEEHLPDLVRGGPLHPIQAPLAHHLLPTLEDSVVQGLDLIGGEGGVAKGRPPARVRARDAHGPLGGDRVEAAEDIHGWRCSKSIALGVRSWRRYLGTHV